MDLASTCYKWCRLALTHQNSNFLRFSSNYCVRIHPLSWPNLTYTRAVKCQSACRCNGGLTTAPDPATAADSPPLGPLLLSLFLTSPPLDPIIAFPG